MPYPELKGTPKACRTSSWKFDILEVRSPYKGVDIGPKELRPLAEDHEELAGTLTIPTEGGLGWGNEEERQWVAQMQQLAATVETETAKYHPAAKDKIVSLARDAQKELSNATRTYEDYDGFILLPRVGGQMPRPGSEGLDKTDGDILYWLDTEAAPPDWSSKRKAARKVQRERWAKAMALLWCARYGQLQSLAWWDNRQEWMARRPGGLGLGLPEVEPKLPEWKPPRMVRPPEAPPEDEEEPPERPGVGGIIAVGVAAAILYMLGRR